MIAHRNFTQLLLLTLVAYFGNEANGEHQDYTDFERRAIDKLRPQIAEYLIPDYMKTDVYHLRILKAVKFDLNDAVEMAQRNRKWRKDNHVDEILDQDLKEYFPDFPFKIEGVDKEGSPIMQFYFGKWRLKKYALSEDRELRKVPLEIFVQAFETVEQRLYEIQKSGGQNISSTYIIDDIVGYSIHEQACYQCLSITTDLIRAFTHYPSLGKKVIQLNVPKIFSRVIRLINEILPSEVKQGFSFYTPNDNTWRNKILKDVSADQLPKDFGGSQNNWYTN